MGAYPYLVNIAWDVISKFIEDWQNEPYRWAKEIEMQVEITSRLSSVYKTIGRDTLVINYKDCISGFKENQMWNRVSNEPPLTYVYSDRKAYKCYPDIVIWDDINKPDAPPDEDENVNFPMLLVCEIKVDWALQEHNNNWDNEKMNYLLNQGDTKYACWLNFCRSRAHSGNGIEWKLGNHDSLWLCNAQLPPL